MARCCSLLQHAVPSCDASSRIRRRSSRAQACCLHGPLGPLSCVRASYSWPSTRPRKLPPAATGRGAARFSATSLSTTSIVCARSGRSASGVRGRSGFTSRPCVAPL
eukprot:5914904-Prymnesium_polylepis.1